LAKLHHFADFRFSESPRMQSVAAKSALAVERRNEVQAHLCARGRVVDLPLIPVDGQSIARDGTSHELSHSPHLKKKTPRAPGDFEALDAFAGRARGRGRIAAS
jgi:hypothetical protein